MRHRKVRSWMIRQFESNCIGKIALSDADIVYYMRDMLIRYLNSKTLFMPITPINRKINRKVGL